MLVSYNDAVVDQDVDCGIFCSPGDGGLLYAMGGVGYGRKHGPLRRKLFSDESLWVEQQPCVDEQKSVDLFESLCFWDKQVGGFPQSENLEPSSFCRNVKRWGGLSSVSDRLTAMAALQSGSALDHLCQSIHLFADTIVLASL